MRQVVGSAGELQTNARKVFWPNDLIPFEAVADPTEGMGQFLPNMKLVQPLDTITGIHLDGRRHGDQHRITKRQACSSAARCRRDNDELRRQDSGRDAGADWSVADAEESGEEKGDLTTLTSVIWAEIIMAKKSTKAASKKSVAKLGQYPVFDFPNGV